MALQFRKTKTQLLQLRNDEEINVKLDDELGLGLVWPGLVWSQISDLLFFFASQRTTDGPGMSSQVFITWPPPPPCVDDDDDDDERMHYFSI